jgi:hypothetical protein
MLGQLAEHVDTATAQPRPLFPLASRADRTRRCAGRSTGKRGERLCVIMLFESPHNQTPYTYAAGYECFIQAENGSWQRHRNAACVKSGGCSAVSSCSA